MTLAFTMVLLGLAGTRVASGQAIHSTVYGDSTWRETGTAVDGVGDLDGDGFGDFIVGAADADTVNGIYSGGARVYSGLDGRVLFEFAGPTAGASFGFAAACAGDVNADGWADMIVGAYTDDTGGYQSGSAWVYSGLDGTLLHSFYGASSNAHFGFSVSGAGDINGDTYADILVGAPRADHYGYEHGSVYVYSGQDGSMIRRLDGTADSFFGSALSAVRDVDGDSVPDIVVGAYRDSTFTLFAGAVYVYSGRTGQALLAAGGGSQNDAFGFSVDDSGDLNLDGWPDVVVGATQFTAVLQPGYVQIISGADATVLHTWSGDLPNDEFGFSVAGMGDVDGDGLPELAVGAIRYYSTGFGLAQLLSGRTGEIFYAVKGQGLDDLLGYSVSAGGDVNGDGYADLLVGAPGDATVAWSAGSATVYALETLRLQPPSPGTAGTSNAVIAEGATPGQPVYFTYGFQEGVEPVPGCPRLSVDIQSPVLGGTAVADPTGTATLTTWVPAAASGRTALLQAVELAPCTVSRLVRHSFP